MVSMVASASMTGMPEPARITAAPFLGVVFSTDWGVAWLAAGAEFRLINCFAECSVFCAICVEVAEGNVTELVDISKGKVISLVDEPLDR